MDIPTYSFWRVREEQRSKACSTQTRYSIKTDSSKMALWH